MLRSDNNGPDCFVALKAPTFKAAGAFAVFAVLAVDKKAKKEKYNKKRKSQTLSLGVQLNYTP